MSSTGETAEELQRRQAITAAVFELDAALKGVFGAHPEWLAPQSKKIPQANRTGPIKRARSGAFSAELRLSAEAEERKARAAVPTGRLAKPQSDTQQRLWQA